jgi:hypothetical protein
MTPNATISESADCVALPTGGSIWMHGFGGGISEVQVPRVDFERASARKIKLTFDRGKGPVFSAVADQRSVPLIRERVPSTTKLPSLS